MTSGQGHLQEQHQSRQLSIGATEESAKPLHHKTRQLVPLRLEESQEFNGKNRSPRESTGVHMQK